jgi:hypothetical protein
MDLPAIRMNPNERNLFLKHIDPKGDYLEWGAGGSTLAALERTAGSILCVETDVEWVNKMRACAPVQHAESSQRLHFELVDLGPTKAWGFPRDASKVTEWPKYAAAPWHRDFKPRTVLVDGRFRVACFLSACLFSDPETTVMIHDYEDGLKEREHYKTVMQHADQIDRKGTLVVLKTRRNSDRSRLNLDLMTYMNYTW